RSELPSAPESLPPLSVAGELARGSRRGDAPPESGAFDIPPSSSGELVYAEIRGGTKLADMKRRIEQECITRALFEAGPRLRAPRRRARGRGRLRQAADGEVALEPLRLRGRCPPRMAPLPP